MKNIAIFVSGNGTNCENIIHHFKASSVAKVVLVVSNKPDAYALVRAHRNNVDTAILSKADLNNSGKVLDLLSSYHVDFIVLAGFLLMVPAYLISAFPKHIVNIHPALLPKFGGKGMYGHYVHEAVKAAGEQETGITIHWVNQACDGGAIIRQYKTAISPTVSAEEIAEKVHLLEMEFYPKVIESLL